MTPIGGSHGAEPQEAITMANTAKLYVTSGQVADIDRPTAKKTIAIKVVDEKGNAIRGFRPTKETPYLLAFGGKLEGMKVELKCSGAFQVADVDAGHERWFGQVLEALEKSYKPGRDTSGVMKVPVDSLEAMAVAAEVSEVEIELS
jgi:hypothetical protein